MCRLPAQRCQRALKAETRDITACLGNLFQYRFERVPACNLTNGVDQSRRYATEMAVEIEGLLAAYVRLFLLGFHFHQIEGSFLGELFQANRREGYALARSD